MDEIPVDLLFSKDEHSNINCVSAVCTHRPVLMSKVRDSQSWIENITLNKGIRTENRIRCHSHGAIFDLASGGVIGAPATKPLNAFPLQLKISGEIEVDVEPGVFN